MRNYKLLIQYDGTDFAGWQIQKDQNTIQQFLTEALEIILREKVNLIGSGRTDAGVHAFGQVAHFKTEKEIDIYKTAHSLNSILPQTISVINMEETEENFHSRFDAVKRSYMYFITNIKSPFYNKYSYLCSEKYDSSQLNQISKDMIGTFDFTSLCKNNPDQPSKICNVYEARWYRKGAFLIFLIESNRFLQGMVRLTVGTILQLAKQNENTLRQIIEAKDKSLSAGSVPAKGLFLYKVKYGNRIYDLNGK